MAGNALPTSVSQRWHRPAKKPGGSFSWGRRLDGLALFAFACSVMFLSGYGQQRILGIAMIVAFSLTTLPRLSPALRRLSPVPPELWLYSAWVVWTGLTGLLVAIDLDLFWAGYRVLLQMFVMVWVAYAIMSNLKNVDVVFLALMTGGLVQIVFVLGGATGLQYAIHPSQRELGTATNPNSLGFAMVWCTLCALSFWRVHGSWRVIRQALILTLVVAAIFVMLASGSRKSALAMGLLVFSWAVFGRATVKSIRNLYASVIIGGVLVFGFVSIAPDLMDSTVVGRRFQQSSGEGVGGIGEAFERDGRYDMYVDGLRIFLEHPVFGVGLNNFQRYFYSGQYSHSEYIEPLATTGLIGFALYQSFYILLLLRIRRLLGVVHDRVIRYRLKVILLGIMAIMVIGLGAPHYTNSPVFLLLTAFSVYTWNLRPYPMRRYGSRA